MKQIVTAEQMRKLERDYMQSRGVPSISLMRRAAGEMTEELCRSLGDISGRICIFACGNGGNGGDGYAAAVLFAKRGGRSIVVEAMPEKARTPDAKLMRNEAIQCGNVDLTTDFSSLPKPSAWVDAIFGIGLTRAPSGDTEALIQKINSDHEKGALVISCDIASGLMSDSGNTPGVCVNADCTVTFECAKAGHYLGKGMDVSGELVVRPIGLDAPEEYIDLLEPEDIKAACLKRRHDSHKGTYGHLLLVAGSYGMAGAAALAANAALRSGVGLVTIACPHSVVPILQSLAPVAMCLPMPEQDGALSDEAADKLKDAIKGKTAVAVGPGISLRCSEEVIRVILQSGIKCLLDADAITLTARNSDLMALLHKDCLITPHPGEAARLCDAPMDDPLRSAMMLKELGCTVIYKGASSVIAGVRTAVSCSGTPGMAKGGSGDVLTGIAGALLARRFAAEEAARIADEVHGLAGEYAEAGYTETGMTAWDTMNCIAEVWKHAR